MTIFTGIPIFEQVQDWFEDLWDWIGEAAYDAAEWLRDEVVKPLEDGVNSLVEHFNSGLGALQGWLDDALNNILKGIGDLITGVKDFLDDAKKTLGGYIDNAYNALHGALETTRDKILEAVDGLKEGLGPLFEDLKKRVDDVYNDIKGGVDAIKDDVLQRLGETGGVILDGVKHYFDGAVEALGSFIFTGIPRYAADAAKWLDKNVVEPLWHGLEWLWRLISDNLKNVLRGVIDPLLKAGEITPEKAYEIGMELLTGYTLTGLAAAGLASVAGIKILGSGLEVGEIGNFINRILDPGLITGMVIGTVLSIGIREPLGQFFAARFRPRIPTIDEATRMYWRGVLSEDDLRNVIARAGFGGKFEEGFIELTKNIPGASDLIRFVVREVITPEDFKHYMAMQGYEAKWADAYWEAHWQLPAPTMLYDAYHRGIITEDELRKYITWHDYKPDPRPGISKSDVEIVRGLIKRLIPRVDLRRGWELGAISDEELVERYKWLGYEEDAELMAEIQKREALRALINKIIDDSKKDFVEGFIDEDTLRANLKALDLRDEVIEFHVEDAKADRMREFKKDLVDLYIDSFVKDYPGWTEETLREALSEVIKVPEVVELLISKAWVRKYRRPRRGS